MILKIRIHLLINKRFYKGSGSRHILDYFNKTDNTANLNAFPVNYRKVITKKNPNAFYLANENTANQIVDVISRYYNKNLPFFEVNPGACILTKSLLERLKPEKLYLIERCNDFNEIQTVTKQIEDHL